MFVKNNYDIIKQNVIIVVCNYMTILLNNIADQIKDTKSEENLFVKNIIVNKDKSVNKTVTYIPTEKWVMQLGKRLEFNC